MIFGFCLIATYIHETNYKMPKYAFRSLIIYMSIVFIYNFQKTYIDSAHMLHVFRSGSAVPDYVKNDWDAAWYGAYNDFRARLHRLFIWPLTLALDFVPALVLYMN